MPDVCAMACHMQGLFQAMNVNNLRGAPGDMVLPICVCRCCICQLEFEGEDGVKVGERKRVHNMFRATRGACSKQAWRDKPDTCPSSSSIHAAAALQPLLPHRVLQPVAEHQQG